MLYHSQRFHEFSLGEIPTELFVPLRPGQSLSHYRLVDQIGAGAMGVVWRAEDTKLGRTVAIKLLAPQLAVDPERRRMFVEEARLAASLSHAHVVQVHELGQEGPLDYIVMEYVEGMPLDRILNGEPLPPAKVLGWGLQVAQGLAQVHRKLLLHRDLKPANLLVTNDDEVKIVDFGVSTLFVPSGHRSGDGTAEDHGGGPAGPVLGTLPYMSPEQLRGEPLDARSDIFSLGTLLYEMATGRRPFSGDTREEVTRAILLAQATPAEQVAPGVPSQLARIIHRALALHRADRYQSMDDLAADLRRARRPFETGAYPRATGSVTPAGWRWPLRARLAVPLLLVGFVAIATVVAWQMFHRSRLPAGDAVRQSVLILPLDVEGPADGSQYLGQAFAEAIAVNLARAPGLRVLPVPDDAGLAPAGRSNLKRAARTLGAGRVVRGSLRPGGDRVAISVSLVDPGSNRLLWGLQWDVRREEVPAVAVTAAQDVARQLGATPAKQYEYFRYVSGGPDMAGTPLLADALGAARRHDMQAALPATERLLQAFPDQPDAHVLRIVALTDASNNDAFGEWAPALRDAIAALKRLDPAHPLPDLLRAEGAEGRDEAMEALTNILSRADLTPAFRAHALRVRARIWASGPRPDLPAALADLEEGIRLDPGNPWALTYYAETLAAAERMDDALDRARQAFALEPTASTAYHVSDALVGTLQFDDAVTWARKAVALDDVPATRILLSRTLSLSGKHEESLAVKREVCAADPECEFSMAVELVYLGRRDEARAVAARAESLRIAALWPPGYDQVCYMVATGRRAEAVSELKRLAAEPSVDLWISRDPALASLHGDPGFEEIVAALRRRLAPEPLARR